MEVRQGLRELATFSQEAIEMLRPFAAKYGGKGAAEASRLRDAILPSGRAGSFGLLRDLHGMFLMASEVHVSTSVLMHAAKMLRDDALLDACMKIDKIGKRQLAWANTQLLLRSPQTLVVPQ
jgi:hypothetical protein